MIQKKERTSKSIIVAISVMIRIIETKQFNTLSVVIWQFTPIVCISSFVIKCRLLGLKLIRVALSAEDGIWVLQKLGLVIDVFLNYLLDNDVVITEATLFRRTLSTTEQILIKSIFAKIF